MDIKLMKKITFLITLFLVTFCYSVFAEKLVLERNINNEIFCFYDKTWKKEQGTVKIYINEFTSTDEKEKFGWAYGIESNLINNSLENPEHDNSIHELFNETESHLMYYINDEKFYIGYVWTNGYTTEVLDSHVFYEFNKKDGYGLYFMLAYVDAVNMLLTGGNKILHTEETDINGKNIYYSGESPDFSFYTGNFPDYCEYSAFRVKQGYTGYRTVKMRLLKLQHIEYDQKGNISNYYIGTSTEAGIKIANNLKKHGLWLVKKSPYGNLGEYLGKYNFNGGVIMCNWEKFIEYGYTQESLNEILKDNPDFGNQIIDYQEIIPKKIIN